MARIRSIKPSFFTDAKICRLSMPARLLFIATWTIADDADGVFDARLSILKSAAFLEDPVTPEQVAAWFAELVAPGLVRLFEDQGVPYAVVRHWGRHQVISKPGKKANPDPPPERIPASSGAIPEIPRNPQESPELPGPRARVQEGGVGVGREGEGRPPEIPGAFPEPPPPPASRNDRSETQDPAGRLGRHLTPAQLARLAPAIARLAARARETIIPPGSAAPAPDQAEVGAHAEVLVHDPAWELELDAWSLPRALELYGQIAASEKHGHGGSYVIGGPADLLRRASKKKDDSRLILDEMLGKFPTRLEPPAKRVKRERAAFIHERAGELARAKIAEKGDPRLTLAEERAAREQAEIEWESRTRAGPAPAGSSIGNQDASANERRER